MKKRNKKIMAVFMALTLTSTIVPAYSYNVWAGEKENNANISVIPQGLILEKENIDIEEGNTYDLTNETGGDMVQALEEGTIIVSFTSTGTQAYQSLISAGNSTNGNRNRYFHLYITDTGALGMELRNTDEVFKYTLSRPASLRGSYKGEIAENTVAFKADKEEKEYKIFANGELLATLKQEDFKFIKDISGVNNVQLGGTMRDGAVGYPFEGTIKNVKVYSNPLSDEELLESTGKTTYGKNIFYAGDETGSNYFRIPTLLTLSSGTVVATADARYGGTHDAKSNIDIAFARSKDSGETWSTPTLPLVFDDYAAQEIDWPRDSVGKNVQINGSASFIDSVTVEDSTTGRLFLFADAMPAGIGFSNTAAGSGFKTVDGEKYVKLHWHKDPANTYNYTIREDGIIYDDRTGMPTEYSVDGDYDLLKNGEYLTQKQYDVHFEGTKLIEEKNDVDVNMNIFYKDSYFKVLPTNFIVMKYSDNEGETWSDMQILGRFKEDNQRVPLYGPGVGTQIKNGEHAGRIILTMYNSISAEFGFLYSDDHGANWNYVTTDLGGSGTFAEAQIVELPDGTLQTYMRTSVGKIGVITSIDGGTTWTEQEFVLGMTAASYGTQLSVISTSQLVDGKPAILLSEPAATNGRRGGKIWVGLVNDTGAEGYDKYDIEWKYCYSIDNDKYGFAYSCMSELPDGNIGIYYEKYDSWSRDELHLKNIMKFEKYSLDELTGNSWLIK
ncbi:sialidase family protein [Blautia hansenii]|uniref:sialidase family protein n=1 Tax=Blautia hansenii TaxID=1322 RepID=UPI0022E5EABB|nr:exo-alpha-sialidase [Blautia hansenii]